MHVLPQALGAQYLVVEAGRRCKPQLRRSGDGSVLASSTPQLRRLRADLRTARPNCCSARTRRISGGCSGCSRTAGYFKDGINDYIVDGDARGGQPGAAIGTKVAAHYRADGAGRRRRSSCALRLTRRTSAAGGLDDFDAIIGMRREPRPTSSTPRCSRTSPIPMRGCAASGARRHAVDRSSSITSTSRNGCDGDPLQPPPPAARQHGRNADWRAPEQRRHRLDAGQMGVPVVRRLGPGLSLRRAGADRSGFRQGPAAAADARVVHAPERPVAGL